MTIEELRALVAAAKVSSEVVWNGVIGVEATTGRLFLLNNNLASTLRSYDLAIEQLQKQTPSVDGARLLLSGAKNLEIQRGGEQTATNALISLTVYEEAPYHGEGFGSSFATAVSASV